MDTEKSEQNETAPPPYSLYSSSAGYTNQVYPESYPSSGKVPDQVGAGYYPAQASYNPAQTGLTPVGTVYGQNPADQQPTPVFVQVTAGPLEDPPPHYLPHSILNFIFCCWIIGIVAIMKSVASRNASMLGLREVAVSESREAKKWNIIALIGGLAFWSTFTVTFCVLVLQIFSYTFITNLQDAPSKRSHHYCTR